MIIDFENWVIVKIYKSLVDPNLVGGRLRRPQTKMGISSGPMTYCHTRLHLGFPAMLKIWQVPACKMEPQRGIII